MDESKRSHIMSMIKSKGTKPEMLVRRYLFAHGFRYRVNVRTLPGTPDIVLRKYRTAIFVHGCFWHGHDCGDFRPPKTRVEFWTAKISRNRERDLQARERLRQLGWRTMVIWGCQLKPGVREETLAEMVYLLGKALAEKLSAKPPKPYILDDEAQAPRIAAEEALPYPKSHSDKR
ncbi:MAG: very short patch repair endonuclease [Mediterranea sp.]|jgi:DNA mismatch endonuclease (patch repair protein)|nr:very short patch repair endonuclease [Mediterranea sp.]